MADVWSILRGERERERELNRQETRNKNANYILHLALAVNATPKLDLMVTFENSRNDNIFCSWLSLDTN